MGLVRARASVLSCPGLQGGGVEGWIRLSKRDLKLGAGQPAGETERQRAPAQAQKDRAEGEMVWRQRRSDSLQECRSRREGLPFPPRLTGSGTGALGARWWRWPWWLRRFGSEADWVRASGGRQVLGGPMTGPPSPALLPWGWGLCARLPAPVTSPSPSSRSFSPRSHPLGSVSLHLCRLLPSCNSVAIFLFASLCLCLSVFLSISVSLSVSLCRTPLILYLSLCLSLSLPPPTSFSQALCLSSCPCPSLPTAQAQVGPWLPLGPPFPAPRRGGTGASQRWGCCQLKGQDRRVGEAGWGLWESRPRKGSQPPQGPSP